MAAVRNISVTISANVRKYTDGLRSAASATQKFQQQVSGSGKVMANNAGAVRTAAREHSQYEKALHGVSRGAGAGMASVDRLSAATRNGNRALAAASEQASLFSKAMTFIKTASVQAMAALGGFAFITTAITVVTKGFSFLKDTVIGFNKSITESMAVMEGGTPQIRAQLEATAMAVSKITTFDPTQVGEGFYHLISAGYDAEQSIAAVGTVALFAQAGVMDLEKATELLLQSQAALGMVDLTDPIKNQQQLAEVADVFTVAAIKSTATIEEFAQAMTNKFGVSLSLAKRSVQEGAAVLMAYARVGVKGRVAGTQAAIFMRDIQNIALKSGTALAKLGIEVYDSAGGMKNLVDIAKDLSANLGDMSAMDLRMTLKGLGFQDRSVQAILPLIATSTEQWDSFNKSANEATGSTARVAAKQLESLSAKLSLVSNAAKRAAISIGRTGLGAFGKAWQAIQQPVEEGIKSMQKFGTEVMDALKPAASLLGGALLVTVKGMAVAFQLLAAVLSGLGPALKPIIIFFTVLKASQMIGGAITSMVGRMNSGFQSLAASAAKAGQSIKAIPPATPQQDYMGPGSGISQAPLRLDRQGQTILDPKVPESFFKEFKRGALEAQGQNAKVAGQIKAGWQQAKLGVDGATRSVGEYAQAAMMAVGAVVGIAMAIKSAGEGFQAQGQGFVDMANAFVDVTDPAGLREGAKYMRDMKGEMDAAASASGNPFAGWASSTEKDKLDDGAAANEAAADRVEKAWKSVAKDTGIPIDAVRDKAKQLGLDLTGAFNSQDQKGKRKELKKALEDLVPVAQGAGLSIEQAARMGGDAMGELETEGTDSAKALGKAMEKMVDPAPILANLYKVSEEIHKAFGKDLTGVFTDLQTAAEDAASKAAQSAADSSNNAVDDQIKAIEDQKKALKKAGPKKKSTSQTDAIDAQTAALDDQIDTLRDGKKAADDFATAATPISAESFLTGLDSEAKKADDFYASIDLLKARLSDPSLGLDQSQIDGIVSQFAAMGAEATPLINGFATATEGTFANMVTRVAASMNSLAPKATVSLADFKKAQGDATVIADGTTKALIGLSGSLNANQLLDPSAAVTPEMLQQFMGLGPEFADLVTQMWGEVDAAADPEAKAMKAQEIATLINQTLTNADYGTGIPDAVRAAMNAASQEAIFGAAKVSSDISTGIVNSVSATETALRAAGLNGAADAWMAKMQGVSKLQADQMLADSFGTGSFGAGTKSGKATDPKKDKNYVSVYGSANGNIFEAFANGGIAESHKAQIAKAGDMRLWAEPETGGEAYIPLGTSKRAQAMPVLAEVARRFGLQMSQYANGGIATPGSSMVGGGHWGVPGAPQIIPVPVPVQSQNITQFNGPIQGVRMEDAEAFAARKRRQGRLAGGRR